MGERIPRSSPVLEADKPNSFAAYAASKAALNHALRVRGRSLFLRGLESDSDLM